MTAQIDRPSTGVAYWDSRWRDGPPCPGSNGDTAASKAAWLNAAVQDLDVRSIVDWGCGDGGQAALVNVGMYVGIEVAPSAWEAASVALATRDNCCVVLAPPGQQITVRADMAVSMDVVFHLTDDREYEEWIARVFGSASRFVAVYGTDYDSVVNGHMRHHEVTRDAPADWSLIEGQRRATSPSWFLWERDRWPR